MSQQKHNAGFGHLGITWVDLTSGQKMYFLSHWQPWLIFFPPSRICETGEKRFSFSHADPAKSAGLVTRCLIGARMWKTYWGHLQYDEWWVFGICWVQHRRPSREVTAWRREAGTEEGIRARGITGVVACDDELILMSYVDEGPIAFHVQRLLWESFIESLCPSAVTG